MGLVAVAALAGAIALWFLNPFLPGRRANPPHYAVKKLDVGLTVLDEGVGNADWSPDGRWIAYTKFDIPNGFSNVWVMRPDGSEKACLSCRSGFPAKHKGAVAFHPSGKFIVYTAQNEDAEGPVWDRVATPGIGFANSIWAMTTDGTKTWRIHSLPTSEEHPRAVIDPRFSPDGSTLYWAENLGLMDFAPAREWGRWAIFFARWSVVAGKPSLTGIRRLQPGQNRSFYIVTDVSPKTGSLIFSGNLSPGQSVNGMDIYTMDSAAKTMKALVLDEAEWDEHAHYSPDGKIIVFMSTRDLQVSFESVYGLNWLRDLRTELWAIPDDGGKPQRLTFFNQQGHPDNLWLTSVSGDFTRAFVSYNDWAPDGRSLIFTLTVENKDGFLTSRLVRMDLGQRPPLPAAGQSDPKDLAEVISAGEP